MHAVYDNMTWGMEFPEQKCGIADNGYGRCCLLLLRGRGCFSVLLGSYETNTRLVRGDSGSSLDSSGNPVSTTKSGLANRQELHELPSIDCPHRLRRSTTGL